MSELRKKPVFDAGVAIGEAATKEAIVELLIERGLDPRAARAAVTTRCVEGRDGYHVVAAGDLDKMMADLRAIVAGRAPAARG